MKRDIYLSIDLDYWSHWPNDWHSRLFFKRVFALGLKVTVALHHHHLLDSINRVARHLRRVVNVDYHSDISDVNEYTTPELNEGTWANFVQHRERMTFEWRYPEEDCLDENSGYCHFYENPFESPCTRWQRVVKRMGSARIPWQRIRAVGVCLSPSWIYGSLWTVIDPAERLGLFDWFGQWCFYNDNRVPTDMDAENGTGFFAPRLLSPKQYGRVKKR